MSKSKKYRRQPPAVATSEAFKIYFERLEAEKFGLEEDKLKRKVIREEKRSAVKQKMEAQTEKRKKRRGDLKRKTDGKKTKVEKKEKLLN